MKDVPKEDHAARLSNLQDLQNSIDTIKKVCLNKFCTFLNKSFIEDCVSNTKNSSTALKKTEQTGRRFGFYFIITLQIQVNWPADGCFFIFRVVSSANILGLSRWTSNSRKRMEGEH